MKKIEMYSKGYCPYCHMAKKLFKQLGWQYTEHSIDKSASKRAEMIRRSKRHTVPQIFIGGEHIGGYDDFSAYIRKLSKLA